jgi:hypothetical protein
VGSQPIKARALAHRETMKEIDYEGMKTLEILMAKKTKEIGEYGYAVWEYRKVNKMDDLDFDDYKEMLSASTNKQLVGLLDYEIRAAKNCVIDEDADMHYELADLACKEMELRGMV